jgi:hypothetical protein
LLEVAGGAGHVHVGQERAVDGQAVVGGQGFVVGDQSVELGLAGGFVGYAGGLGRKGAVDTWLRPTPRGSMATMSNRWAITV